MPGKFVTPCAISSSCTLPRQICWWRSKASWAPQYPFNHCRVELVDKAMVSLKLGQRMRQRLIQHKFNYNHSWMLRYLALSQGQGAFDVIEIGLKQTIKVQRIMTHWCKIPSSKPDIMKDSPKMCICFPCWEVWRAFVCFAAMTVVRAKDRAGGRVTLPSKPSNPHTQLR